MIFELSSLFLPSIAGVERGLPPGVSVEHDVFYQGYDQCTLFYDCFFDDEAGKVKFYAPSLLKFESVLASAIFKADREQCLKWTLKRHRCYDVLEIVADDPTLIELRGRDWASCMSVQRHARELFSGGKVLLTVSKNNDLKWIRDWVIYHQRNHEVDSVVIVDNGSSAYSLNELSAEIASAVGCRSAVISAPLPYGPTKGAKNGLGRANFFQTAMLNLVRDRFLAHAQGVLSIDVDELVVSRRGHSVFKCLQNSWLGFVSFGGEWRYPEDNTLQSHGAHFWMADGDQACPAKYCYRPGSLLGSLSLGVHGLQTFRHQMMPSSRDFFFAHCRNISTGWKWGRDRRHGISGKDEYLLRSLQNAGLISYFSECTS